jgi:hypothetical protein
MKGEAMETESQTVLRRAKEALDYYREREKQAIETLAGAREDVRKAREKYEQLFLAEEMREAERRRNRA